MSMTIGELLKKYNLSRVDDVLRPKLDAEVVYKKDAVTRLTGLVLGRGETTIAFSMGEHLLEIPIDAVTAVDLDNAPPAVVPTGAIAVNLSVFTLAKVSLRSLVPVEKLGGADGLKPFVLSVPSDSPKYSVPASEVAARDKARADNLNKAKKPAAGDEDEDWPKPPEIETPGAETEKDTITYSKLKTWDTKESKVYQSPHDSPKSVGGVTMYSTDFQQDTSADATTDYGSTLETVEQPAISVDSPYDTKETKTLGTPFETKRVELGQQVVSPDSSQDFTIDTTTDSANDMEHV